MSSYDSQEWQRQAESLMPPFSELAQPTNIEESLVKLTKSALKGCESLLEVGCIDGRYYGWLAGHPKYYTGVDVTPAFIERAKAYYPYSDFRVGDIRSLSFGKNTFDCVLCGNVLQHLPDLKPLAGLFAIARKRVVISVYGAKKDIEERHGFGFLNFYYPRSVIEREIPKGWKIKKRIKVIPEWDVNMFLYQYIFER